MPPFSLPALAPPTAMSVAQFMDDGVSFASGRGEANKYGMQMWFKVTVGNLPGKDLGEWSQCSGLGVTFTMDDLKTGAGGLGKTFLPKDIEFPEVKLTRASEPTTTQSVRTWLQKVAQEWVLTDGTSTPYAGATVTIELFSALQSNTKNSSHKVHEWVLTGVYPKSWTGPQFNAKSNDVATEQLTLVHDGWMELRKDPDPYLTLFDGRTELRFPSMPADIKVLRQAPSSSSGTVIYNSNDQVVDRTKTQITMATSITGASEVKWVHETLLKWVKTRIVAEPSQPPTKISGEKKEEKPVEDYPIGLRLTIGRKDTKFVRTVSMTKADTTFKYFTLTGEPARAEFSLGFEVMVPRPGETLAQHPGLADLPSAEEEPRGPAPGFGKPQGLGAMAFVTASQKRRQALRSSAPVAGKK